MKKNSSIIHTSSGPLHGYVEDNVNKYLGIPYALPPTGNMRWKEPQLPICSHEVIDCTKYASAAPQITENNGPLKNYENINSSCNEDCLYLNIFSPVKKEKKLPVLFWLHGGGLIIGSGSNKLFDGSNLAKHGIIVVTINYRLGALGFMTHKQLAKESKHNSSGNYGLLDQIAALKWVKNNIEKFNGDPDNITLSGQSAGGICSSILASSPLCKNIISKVIILSATEETMQLVMPDSYGTIDSVYKNTEKLIDRLKIETDDILALRNIEYENIVKHTEHFDCIFHKPPEFQPVEDNYVLAEGGLNKAFAEKTIPYIPTIIGFTQDDGSLFAADLTLAEYQTWLKKTFKGKLYKSILNKFPAAEKSQVPENISKIFKMFAFILPTMRFADYMSEFSNVYVYSFNRKNDTQLGKDYGVAHTSELPYIFGNLDLVGINNNADKNISEDIMRYWINFIKTGTPNGNNTVTWPEFHKNNRKIIYLDSENSVGPLPEEKNSEYFNSIWNSQINISE
jgi:para-nitrobenzyl esterase